MPISDHKQVDDTEVEVEVDPTESVGDILRAERLRQELTEKDVADQLHITMHYVRAIESNSFGKLPGAVFTKGYIKSYALLLGLEQSLVIGSYDDYVNDQQDAAREKTRIQVRRRKDRNRPWLIGSGAAFVSLFLGLWFLNSGPQDSSEVISEQPSAPDNEVMIEQESPAAALTQALSEAPLVLSSLDSVAEDAKALPVLSDSLADVVEELTSEELVAALLQNESRQISELQIDLESELESELQDNPGLQVDPDQQQDLPLLETVNSRSTPLSTVSGSGSDGPDASNELALEESGNEGQRVIVEAEGSDVLLINFAGESWVEVSDDSENLLYRDLSAAGNVLEIRGTAPFNVLLGDAPFAEMTLNGNDIDMSKNIRIDNSARLTVGL